MSTARAQSAASRTKAANSAGKSSGRTTTKKSAAAPTRTAARSRALPAARTHDATIAPGRVREAADQFVRMIGAASPHEQQLLVDAVSGTETDTEVAEQLDEDLWGPAPTAAEVRAAELAQLRRRFADRARVTETALTREEAAELLGITAQAITDYLAKGDLVGIKNGRSWMLPSWEFDPDLERGIVPGIRGLRDAFPGGVVSLTKWVSRPSVDLSGRTPRDALAAGEVEKVIDVASTLTAAGW